MTHKKLILIFGAMLCASAIFAIYKLPFVLQSGGISGVTTFKIIFLLIIIFINVWAGINLIKDKEKIYKKLNVPVGTFFVKPLPAWLVIYAFIVVAIIVAMDFMK